MSKSSKLIDHLEVKDFLEHPIWEFALEDSDELSDLWVHPVYDLPTKDLGGCVVGVEVQLANGANRWAILSNIEINNPMCTKHFLAVSIENNGKWFNLARYHDSDYENRGSRQLAEFLGLPVEDVFPILYDITRIAQGNVDSLRGSIEENIKDKLSKDELLAMAVAND